MMTPWSLWIGPGSRLGGLKTVLESLRGAAGQDPAAPDVQLFRDLAELPPDAGGGTGRLVLDADDLPLEDLGYVRRFLEARPDRRLVLTGDDPGRRAARTLLGREGVHFLPWPPNLEDLDRWLEAPVHTAHRHPLSPTPGTTPGATPEAPAVQREPFASAAPSQPEEPAHFPSPGDPPTHARARRDDGFGDAGPLDEDELTVIRTILAQPPSDAAPAFVEDFLDEDEEDELEPLAPASTVPELGIEDEDDEEEDEELTVTDVLSPKAPPPPRYFREQVADLADIAQAIDLGLRAENAEDAPVARDVARLVQFTRTLGYLVAPPGRGDQEFDLAVLLKELVAQFVARGAGKTRCLYLPEGEVPVRSEKQLLTQAFDALLFLAASCAAENEAVRVRARSEDGTAQVEIEFPVGPLEDLEPERVVEPYGLRDRLPDLGPNALRAAFGIFDGQGGRAHLARLGPRRLVWAVELPLATGGG